MSKQPGFTMLLVRNDTHAAIKREAESTGMKLWAIADRAVMEYIQANGVTH